MRLDNILEGATIFATLVLVDVGLNYLNNYRNLSYYQKTNLSELSAREIFQSERKKFGLQNSEINLVLDNPRKYGCDSDVACATGNNLSFKVIINPEYASKISIKHELCHVKRMASGSFLSGLVLGQIEEWMATSCSLED